MFLECKRQNAFIEDSRFNKDRIKDRQKKNMNK